jgi:acyl-CoA synthetase (AMP-forming)/AMP-acid ligase II
LEEVETVHSGPRTQPAETGEAEFLVDGADPASCRITVPQLIARQATRFPVRELVIDGAARITFAQFEANMTRVARAAMALGVRPGDRISIWAPNSARWLLAAMGCEAAGAVLVPMNSRYRGTEAADVVSRARPRLLFTTRSFLNTDCPAMLRRSCPDLCAQVVVLDADAEGTDLTWEQFIAAGDPVAHDDAVAVREGISPDAVSDIILTSGTTGTPKGAMTSHYQNVLAWIRYIQHIGLRDGERANATLPFFHNFGLKEGFLDSVICGGACIIDPTFGAGRLAELIEAERITYLAGTPTMFSALLDRTEALNADLGSLRGCCIAGAAINPDLVTRVKKVMSERTVIGYGLSELAGGISLSPVDSTTERDTQWSGSLVHGVEVRIADDMGRDLPPGQPGEILARGECVMVGYMDNQEATAAAIDADGWLHTGDIGMIDEENYIKIVDRKKEMLIVGGFNTYPAEIEQLMSRHPSIAQAAVVGMPDERLGEVPAAFVVARDGARLTAEEVIAWSRENMANYKVPRRVEIVGELPMNSSLKVVKNELRERLLAVPAGSVPAPVSTASTDPA